MDDERVTEAITKAVQAALSADGSRRFLDVTRVPLICQSIVNMATDIKEISDKLDRNYVTKEAFWPVKTIVYSLVGVMLLALIGAILYTILPHGAVFLQQP
jgi:hypothetical protein